MKERTPWIVVKTDGSERPGEFGHCERCGIGLKMDLPMPAYLAAAMMKAFVKEHSKCEKSLDMNRCRYNATLIPSKTPGKKWDAVKCGEPCEPGMRFCPRHEAQQTERLRAKLAKEKSERAARERRWPISGSRKATS
jgi:hypothetical protein